jgi:hypothetical protein
MSTGPTSQPVDDIGRFLRADKAALVSETGGRFHLRQPGGLVLDEPFDRQQGFPLPAPDAASGSGSSVVPIEPVIETFLVGDDGGCNGMGTDSGLIERWQPAVAAFAGLVLDAATDLGVNVTGPISVTASLTPLGQVVNTPHLDDPIYEPTDGVGLAAVVGSHRGPRLAIEPVEVPKPMAGTPLAVDRGSADRVGGAGPAGWRSIAANRIVLFPLFGQLHAGPTDLEATGLPNRSLLVLRAATAP